MTSATPVPGGPSPNSWIPPRNAACGANSEPQPWPPPSSPSGAGNNNVRPSDVSTSVVVFLGFRVPKKPCAVPEPARGA